MNDAIPRTIDRSDGGGRIAGRRVVTAALAFLLFLVAFVVLIVFQERSVLLTCLQLPGTDLSTCLPGVEKHIGEGGTIEEPMRNAIANVLSSDIEPAKARFAVQITLLGAVAAGAVTLMLLVLFPDDLLKFDGSFKHGSTNMRFSGAVGVFLLVAASGGYLAYRSIPAEAQYAAARRAAINADSAMREAERRAQLAVAKINGKLDGLVAELGGLVEGLSEKQDDYAFNLLVHGYFRKMRGTYAIHCNIESANDSARPKLPPQAAQPSVDTTQAAPASTVTNLDVYFGPDDWQPHADFEIPIKKLAPGDESKVEMTLKRNINDQNLVDLSRTTFDIRPTALKSKLTDSFLYVRTEINQGQLAQYCRDRANVAAAARKTRGELWRVTP